MMRCTEHISLRVCGLRGGFEEGPPGPRSPKVAALAVAQLVRDNRRRAYSAKGNGGAAKSARWSE